MVASASRLNVEETILAEWVREKCTKFIKNEDSIIFQRLFSDLHILFYHLKSSTTLNGLFSFLSVLQQVVDAMSCEHKKEEKKNWDKKDEMWQWKYINKYLFMLHLQAPQKYLLFHSLLFPFDKSKT